MADIAKSLSLLFDRPNEPLITPKGESKAVFQLTEQFLTKEYESNGIELNNRFGDDASERIPLKALRRVPAFSKARQLPADADFSLFLPKHQQMANEVIEELMSVPENDLQEFLATCVYARVHLNPQIFNYSYSVALMHRKDTKNIPVANFAETFPSKFLNSQVFSQAREIARVIPEDVDRDPIIIPRDYTASDLDVEHRLAYFREDIGVNLHHWHWHMVYPYMSSEPNGKKIVNKDRRGELFYYMHQQLVARYNAERLCNYLKRVKKLSEWREPIEEAYFPKLDSLTSSRGYPPRQTNMKWSDLNRKVDDLVSTISEMERWRKNIEEAIATGTAKFADGTTQPLTIDMLGNMVEASTLSPNRALYGNVHNIGHMFVASMHDPDHRYLESYAVMADQSIAVRDPSFFRWHAYIDDLFQKHKESAYLNPYTMTELENQGVQVQSAIIESSAGEPNTLHTYWMQSDLNLARGLDFTNRGPVYVRFTHLNYRPFSYVIKVQNSGQARRATVRIFIAPKNDERNLPWIFSDQRRMFIEMDRFVVPLNAGQNTITRQSTESSVTIPFEQTFRDLSRDGDDPQRPELAAFNFCGCGWPQHMLVPRGTEAGAQFQLFVMLSNYELDKVNQPLESSEKKCVEASSFCGLKDKLYPDKRSMGFPFDRPSRTVTNIEEFILPNMTLSDITILHKNITELNPRNVRS